MFDRAALGKRGTVPLVVALAVDMIGSGLFMPISLLYFTAVTHIPLTTVGLLMSAATLATLPLPVLIGYLADRWNPRDLVLVAQVLQAAGFAMYRWVDGPIAILAVVVVVAVGQRVFWSSFFTLVAGLAEPGEERRLNDQRFALVGMVQAAGTGLGALVGGLVLVDASVSTYRLVALANAVSFAVSALLLTLVPRGARRAPQDAPQAASGGGYRVLLRDRPYLLLIAANTVFALCSVMVGIAVPVYIIEGAPSLKWLIGPLLAVNTLLLATGQGLVVRWARPLSRVRAMVVAGVLWLLWSVAFAAALQVPAVVLLPYLLISMVFYAGAELLHAPISNALAAAAAPEHVRGRYLAVFQYCFTIANIVAPTFFTVLYAHGAALPWIVLGALTAVATAAMFLLEKRLPAEEPVSVTSA
ncbi:MFS transporter [Dactylosporangium sucinum]|uniref:MFS transporter n=1 Tax=Dactylosporangium sucinum TaxID=1424081 RepID=A0A917X6I8_9ACTN|nr:MFS transporter [Dactylosporangium sucinum]GGM86988.1 MFS transporter [Dactylosporangium sucinum]